MLNLTLEEVKAYQKDYTAVPVAKECLADMTTPLAFLAAAKTAATIIFCWKVWRAVSAGDVILLSAMIQSSN